MVGTAAAVVTLAAIAAAVVYTSPLEPEALRLAAAPESVRVADATDTVSLAVPAEWAGELQASGWNPATIRLTAGQAPGLAVAADLDRWRDPTQKVPGVFAGSTPALVPSGVTPALPSHDGCTRIPDRRYTSGGLTGTVQRWVRCAGTQVSFSEVVLVHTGRDYGVYVQIKQVAEPDRTDDILRSLRLRTP